MALEQENILQNLTNIKTIKHSMISLLLGGSVSVPIYDLDQQVKI